MPSPALPLVRSPAPGRPEIHQIVLPTPWPIGPVQVYLVEAEPLTLVDTGVRDAASRAALGAALEALGHGLEDVRRIVLTHYHEDHLGQAETIRRASPEVEVWCHEHEVVWCEAFSAERGEWIEPTEALFRELGVPEPILARQTARRREHARKDPLCDATRIDRALRAGERVGFKDFDLEVLHAPGHTPGHLLLHDAEAGVLVTGDHLMGNAVPFTDYHHLEGEGPDLSDPLARRPRFQGLPRYLESLRALRGLPLRTILPAHGGIVERPARAIENARLFYEVRIQRTVRALAKAERELGRAVTAFEIWERAFPKADPVEAMRNRMYLLIGALDLEEAAGRVGVARRGDGVLVFETIAAA
jgi:glyoxylase-like metal-dependent hydrolase (beta-lactamase superfamily II)